MLPSGENAGDPSFAGPETTPGAKICGVGADEVDPPRIGGGPADAGGSEDRYENEGQNAVAQQ